MGTTWDKITERQKALEPFYRRVDKTRSRLKMRDFYLTHPLAPHPKLDDVVNVTENRSVSFMQRLIAGIMGGRWQTVVEGQISDRRAHRIEQFLDAAWQQADDYVFNQHEIADLDTWLANHVCHTTLIGALWITSLKDGEYHIDCTPLDMRWTPFSGREWIAPITWLDAEDLRQELDRIAEKREITIPANLKDTDNEVRDYWDATTHELWVNEAMVFGESHSFGAMPAVRVFPATGFLFRDKDYLEFESPSALYANEGLYDQLSRQLSIDATLAFTPVLPAYEYETKNPSPDGTSDAPPRRGETLERGEGESHKPLPTPDINRAELATRDQITSLIEQAAPSAPRNYTSPPSAIEVTTEVEILDQLQNPRIIALQRFKEALARLILHQVSQLDVATITVGPDGRGQEFSVEELRAPQKFSVSYRLLKQNKRLAVVNEARALAAWGKFPTEYILKDILAVEDPDGWMRKLEMEKARVANPAIGLAEMAIQYANEALALDDEVEKGLKNVQSMELVSQYVRMKRNMTGGGGETQAVREAVRERGNPNTLISLLGPQR